MGIVQRQTLRGTAWSYLGAILGFINIAILSPRIFSTGEIGVVQLLVSFASILAQLSSLGFTNVINRLFPYFRDLRTRHNGFFALSVAITLAGFLLAIIFLKFYTPHFEEINRVKSPLISEFSFYLPALLLITLLFNLLDNYNKVLFDAVLGTFLREFLFRIFNLALIGLFWLNMIDFSEYLFGYVVGQGVLLIIIVVSLVIRGEISLRFSLSFLSPELKRQILLLSFFGTLTGLSTYVLTTLDKIFINKYMGEGQVGIYAIASYFAVLILIPGRSIAKISTPFLAESWKSGDIATIDDIYIRSSINQYAVGLLIFVGLLVNMSNIFRLLPDAYSSTSSVIILIGLGNLITVSSGISSVVLSTSELYRYQTWLMFILIGLFVISSLVCIPLFGITGAAVATSVSGIIYSTLGVIVVGRYFKLWPYRVAHLKMTVIGIVAAAAGYLIPEISLIPDIILRSAAVTLIFTGGVYFLRLSPDLNSLAESMSETLRSFRR